MINSVKVINDLGEELEMGIWKPDKTGLLISNIEGTSPSSATVNTTNSADIDGSEYNSTRFEERVITISFYYNDATFRNKNIEDLRHLSYQFFPVKRNIRLIFDTDNRISWIEGHIEDVDNNIFSKQEEVSVSIKCSDPYFRKFDGIQTYELTPRIDMFEFPFSNESLEYPMLIMSEMDENNRGRFFYEGDVDTGCTIHITFDDYCHDLKLFNQSSGDEMRLNTCIIQTITEPRIVGHLSGITDHLGEYIWDEGRNILEGWLPDGLVNVYGVLTGLESSYGEFMSDEYGGVIEGFFPEVYMDENSEIASTSKKLTILVPIDDSDDENIHGIESKTVNGRKELSMEILEAEVTPGIKPKDEIIINTIKGKKSAILIRNGNEYNILSAVDTNSKWLQVVRGFNYMGYEAFYGEDSIHIEYTYEPLYAGV